MLCLSAQQSEGGDSHSDHGRSPTAIEMCCHSYAEEHMRAGHPQSLQNLDFGKHTPRAPLARAQQEEEAQNTDQLAPVSRDRQSQQLPARSQSAVGHSSRPR